jgi:uncharacterized membrane-anchored protein YhcB (DUF1043 family)
MAEIHVQTKKHNNTTPTWIWIVIGLLIAAVVVYLVMRNKTTDNTPNNQTGTSYLRLASERTIPAVYRMV